MAIDRDPRRCVECGAEQRLTHGHTSYPESGLNNVELFNVPIWVCSNGHEEVQIPAPQQLHELLAQMILKKSAPLTGPEVRFLRKRLSLSGREFAKKIGISAVHISRVENGERPFRRPLNLLIRLFFVNAIAARDGKAPAAADVQPILEQLEQVMDIGSHRLEHVEGRHSDEWREAA